MDKVLDSYNEIGFFNPLFKKMKRIGVEPGYWAYRLNWWLVNKLHYTTRFPIHLDIETTNHCNLKCTMCPHGLDSFSMEKGYFSFNMFKQLMRECQDFNPASIKLNIRGEPPDAVGNLCRFHSTFLPVSLLLKLVPVSGEIKRDVR